MPGKKKMTELIVETENLRIVSFNTLNYSVGLQSSFREDTIDKLSKKALMILKEIHKGDL